MKSLSTILFLFQVFFIAAALDFGADFGNTFFEINIDRDHPDAVYKEFEDFIVKYKRNYKDDVEKQFRFQQFAAHHNNAGKLNKKAAEAGHDTKFGINKFADRSKEEIQSMYSKVKPVSDPNIPAYKPITRRVKRLANGFPDNFDLRNITVGGRSIIGLPKNQGQCACCWAFAATALAEYAYSAHLNRSVLLSDQEICDCGAKDKPGCRGGDPRFGLQQIKDFGVTSQSKYPYHENRSQELGRCDHKERKLQPYTLDFYSIGSADAEHQILEHLYLRKRPVSVAFKVGDAFEQYLNGTLRLQDCNNDQHWHSGVIIGYGTDRNENGKKEYYWLFRNSWGADWADLGGHVKIVRGGNWCNIEDHLLGAYIPE